MQRVERGEGEAMNVQWYPGHMTKTRRMMEEQITMVDMVLELLDARIPISSRNPDIDAIAGAKPRLIILNRVDQADPHATKAWRAWFEEQGLPVLETDAKTGKGIKELSANVRSLLQEKLAHYAERGMAGKKLRAMVVGVPNVGKSTFINKVAGRNAANAQNRPGVTRGRQWITVDSSLELMDTPGILWPKFEDPKTGIVLAFTGAVKDDILDKEELAFHLMEILARYYPQRIAERYRIDVADYADAWEMLGAAADKRGFKIRGGEVDLERMCNTLLTEYRDGKLGAITFELPEDIR